MEKWINKKIPVIDDPPVYEERDFIDSPLVEVKAGEKIKIAMQYPELGFKNGEARCYLRKEAAQKLQEAAALLPDGYAFCVWDAWRPFALQEELYYAYREQIIEEFNLKDLPEAEREAAIGAYVANPIPNHDVPPYHTTGGAIDLTITGPKGELLEMGTGFDDFTDKTRTTYFEDEEGDEEETIRNNRRLLYHIMTSVGFSNLPSEWWHYSYGDRSWGYQNKVPAQYRGIFSLDEQ